MDTKVYILIVAVIVVTVSWAVYSLIDMGLFYRKLKVERTEESLWKEAVFKSESYTVYCSGKKSDIALRSLRCEDWYCDVDDDLKEIYLNRKEGKRIFKKKI